MRSFLFAFAIVLLVPTAVMAQDLSMDFSQWNFSNFCIGQTFAVDGGDREKASSDCVENEKRNILFISTLVQGGALSTNHMTICMPIATKVESFTVLANCLRDMEKKEKE